MAVFQLAVQFCASAWPLVAVVAIWIFRRELRAIIPRIREAFGTKFDGAQEAVERSPEKNAQLGTSLLPIGAPERAGLPEVHRNAFASIDATVRDESMSEVQALISNRSQSEAIQLLSELLVISRRATTALVAVRIMHGSQIDLLTRTVETGSATRAAIEVSYRIHSDRGGTMKIEDWIQYPITRGLLIGDLARGVTITPWGRDFLGFITTVIGESAQTRAW